MNQSTGSLPKPHQTMLLAHRAMLRDLDRLTTAAEALSEREDAARAAGLRSYADKLLTVIEHHHEGEDEFLWPKLREQGANEEALSLMTSEHEELNEVLHRTQQACARLGDGGAPAAELAAQAGKLRTILEQHAADEERELTGRLAPALNETIWKGFEKGMLKTAPKWTLRFMPPWLNSVARPGEEGGVPAPPMARLFAGWLDKQRQSAFGTAG